MYKQLQNKIESHIVFSMHSGNSYKLILAEIKEFQNNAKGNKIY